MTLPKTPPCKADIAVLEPFEGLEIGRIFVVTNADQAVIAIKELKAAKTVGFDTESKPTFLKGQKSEGPHVLQFSTLTKAFIFQPNIFDISEAVVELLKSSELTKIGFGLKGDLSQISNRFGIRPASIVDLDACFKKQGYRNAVGAKSAIAILFNRRMVKSKTITTSNWAIDQLSDRQLVYAANDAYAAIRVYHAMNRDNEAI